MKSVNGKGSPNLRKEAILYSFGRNEYFSSVETVSSQVPAHLPCVDLILASSLVVTAVVKQTPDRQTDRQTDK